MRQPLLPASVVLLLASPAVVEASEPGKTEVTVFLGASLHEPSVTTRNFPDVYPFPIREAPGHIPQFEERVSLGGSFLQGFKVGRTFGERVAIEVGFSVAPSHERRSQFDLPIGWPPVCLECVVGPDGTVGGGSAPIWDPSVTEEKVVAISYDAGITFDLATGPVRPYVLLAAGGVSYDASHAPTETDFHLSLGAGLRLGGGSLQARVEVVDAVTPDHFLTGTTEHDVAVRCGVSVRVPSGEGSR